MKKMKMTIMMKKMMVLLLDQGHILIPRPQQRLSQNKFLKDYNFSVQLLKDSLKTQDSMRLSLGQVLIQLELSQPTQEHNQLNNLHYKLHS
jgi:hypothetical protein